MTSMTWQCDGQDEARAESLMGLISQGLRFHHGGIGRRRHRFARSAQPRPKTPQPTPQRDDLDRALAVERTTREALQRRIRELEGKLAALSGAHAAPSTSDEMALLDLKSSLSGAATGAVDLEPLQLWLAEAELRADAAAGAGGWTGGEVELIPSLVDLPASRPKARPENARVAFEAAEARAAHNAAQVRRLTEELAEARSEQMKTMARLRELEAKFRYAEERAGLAGEPLQKYLPEPPSTWKQPDFVPEDSSVAEPSLDEALAAWGSGETKEEAAAESVAEEDISLDDALASWGKADLESMTQGESVVEDAAKADDAGEEDLDDILAAWGEGDLSGVGGQAVEEEDEASLEALSDGLGAWDEADDSASEHRATGQTEGDVQETLELDPMTGAASGFTAQEPAADFSPEQEEVPLGEETAQPYLDSFATGEQGEASEAWEGDEDALTDALTAWGAEQDEDAAETAPEDETPEDALPEDVVVSETFIDDQIEPEKLGESLQPDADPGELDVDSLEDVPLEEISEEQPEPTALGIDAEIAPEALPESIEESLDIDEVVQDEETTEEDDPGEEHTWGPAIAGELSDAEETQFETGLAAASSPVDYTGDLESDEGTFEPDIALDEEARTYTNGGAATEIDEQLSDETRASYDADSTPELHLDDEVAEQAVVESETYDDAPVAVEEPTGSVEIESEDFEVEPDFTPEAVVQADDGGAQSDASSFPESEEFAASSDVDESTRDEQPEAQPYEASVAPNIDVDTVVAARIAGREAVEGNVAPESMRRSLRDWSGLAAARREAAAREGAAAAASPAEPEPLTAARASEEAPEARAGGLREKMRASREVHGKKKMVDALMRFMGDR